MTIKLSHTFLLVRDQDEALKFYRDVLGLEVRTDVPFEGVRWLTVGPPGQPDVEIVLEVAAMGRAADQEALELLLAKGSLSGLIFLVDDVDATFERVRAAGAEVMQEPIDQPYGVRDCGVRDPSGNNIRFSQRLSA
ncbi:VOC family protein [Solwaraspora sp. WMMD937]|uniref:VOC family protein n=1 Tax=Solwaraspora sp. WMMD937 TaxID=3016090 RepID=UPI00249B0B9C|nr:VOC family protein [Solwaraspora sp. WMMD937]WFE23656.1 VOC family protein [Solwaraspora sp. WMMD937]